MLIAGELIGAKVPVFEKYIFIALWSNEGCAKEFV